MTRTTDPKVFSGWTVEDRVFLPDAPKPGDEREIVLIRRFGEASRVVGVPWKWVYHSPDGFEWGYGGSGPADLALNILGMFVNAREAWRLHNKLKFDIIGSLSREDGEIRLPLSLFYGWIRGTWAREDEEGGPRG